MGIWRKKMKEFSPHLRSYVLFFSSKKNSKEKNFFLCLWPYFLAHISLYTSSWKTMEQTVHFAPFFFFFFHPFYALFFPSQREWVEKMRIRRKKGGSSFFVSVLQLQNPTACFGAFHIANQARQTLFLSCSKNITWLQLCLRSCDGNFHSLTSAKHERWIETCVIIWFIAVSNIILLLLNLSKRIFFILNKRNHISIWLCGKKCFLKSFFQSNTIS